MGCRGFLVLFVLATVGAGQVPDPPSIEVVVSKRGFELKSRRMLLRVEDGVLVYLQNVATGEVHADGRSVCGSVPSGLGVVRNLVSQMKSLHGQWTTRGMPKPGRPDDPSNVLWFPSQRGAFEATVSAGGVTAIWTGLTNGISEAPQARLQITATLDQITEDIIFSLKGSDEPGTGVFGIQMPIANLHRLHSIYVPSFGGMMYPGKDVQGLTTLGGGAPFLEAPVIAAEGRSGAFAIWSEDPRFTTYFGFLSGSDSGLSIAIEHLNLMPFEQCSEIAAPSIRLNVCDGNWAAAMSPYRRWYAREFQKEIETRNGVAWAKKIRVIVDQLELKLPVLKDLLSIASRDQILVHDWYARRDPFDTNLPSWVASQAYEQKVSLLHSVGLKVMAYLNTYCVNVGSSAFQNLGIASFGLPRLIPSIARYTDRGASFQTAKQGELMYLDPLSPGWRRFHADQVVRWRDETKTDANYEDVGGTAGDFGNGTIDGLSGAEGGREQFRELLRRNPEVPMASEYAPDHMAFAVAWPLRYQQVWGDASTHQTWLVRQRPVSAFIHGPGTRPWIPTLNAESEQLRMLIAGCSDALGGIAQLPADQAGVGAVGGMLGHLRLRAKLFANLDLEPHFGLNDRDPKLACEYVDSAGHRYSYRVDDTVQAMQREDGTLLYQRISGRTSIEGPLGIVNWPGRSGSKIVGLNPKSCYAMQPTSTSTTPVELSGIPSSVFIGRCFGDQNDYCFNLESSSQNAESIDLQLDSKVQFSSVLVNGAEIGPLRAGESRSIRVTTPVSALLLNSKPDSPAVGDLLGVRPPSGRYVSANNGIERGGIYQPSGVHEWSVPGYEQAPPFFFVNGGADSEATLDYLFMVPSTATSLIIPFRNTQASAGNGTIARVRINGRTVVEYDTENHDSQNPDVKNAKLNTDLHLYTIPIGRFAGKSIVLSLATDPKANNNSDELWWGRPKLVSDPEQRLTRSTIP